VQELRKQLDAEKKRSAELEEELDNREKEAADLRRNLSDRDKELEQLRSELSDLKQKSATAGEFPDVYDLLNRVKAEDSKSKLTPGDIKKIFRILKDS
jgi:predicted  nucleic acid-binding Zn-ribbon protein